MTSWGRRTEAVRECIESIDERPGALWDPKKLAEESGMPYATFRRRFEAAVGCPVYQYIRFRRLQQSARILRMGGSVAEAVEKGGFETLSGFYKAFQSVYGVSYVEFAETRGQIRMREPEPRTVEKFRVSGRIRRPGKPSDAGADIFPEVWSGAEEEIFRTLCEENTVMAIYRREPPENFVCLPGRPVRPSANVPGAGVLTAGGECLRFPVPAAENGLAFFEALHAVWFFAVTCRLPESGLRQDERRMSFVARGKDGFGLFMPVRQA